MYCELIIIGKEYVLSSISIIMFTIIIIPLSLACSSFPHEDRPFLLLKGSIVWCFVMRTLVLHLVFVLFACNYLDAYHLIRPARRHGRPGPSLTQSRFIIDKTFGFMLSYYYRYRSPLSAH